MLPEKLQNKLNHRTESNAFRNLSVSEGLIDFSSNDYLGFASSKSIHNQALNYLKDNSIIKNGSTGSRLLTGNHQIYTEVEQQLSQFHGSESALIFNSGYTANIGFFSCVPQRNDIVLYDEFCHASIRDGFGMSHAKTLKFTHNNLKALQGQLEKHQKTLIKDAEIYVVTEAVFSMDGDAPDLRSLAQICSSYNARLIIDEAHAIGVLGANGYGTVQELELEDQVFARIVTFGKALGCHGAAVLGSKELCDYLINFSRPFIYTTALSPHTVATIKTAYDHLSNQIQNTRSELNKLQTNIAYFKSELFRLQLEHKFVKSDSAIHSCIISGNENVKHVSEALKTEGFNVKSILSPTVPVGKERLRFCIHSYNSEAEITKVLEVLATFVTNE